MSGCVWTCLHVSERGFDVFGQGGAGRVCTCRDVFGRVGSRVGLCRATQGRIWMFLDVSWRVWTCLEVFRRVWTCRSVSGRAGTCRDVSGHVWACRATSVRVWTCVDVLGRVWTGLEMSKHVWTCLDVSGCFGMFRDVFRRVCQCPNVLAGLGPWQQRFVRARWRHQQWGFNMQLLQVMMPKMHRRACHGLLLPHARHEVVLARRAVRAQARGWFLETERLMASTGTERRGEEIAAECVRELQRIVVADETALWKLVSAATVVQRFQEESLHVVLCSGRQAVFPPGLAVSAARTPVGPPPRSPLSSSPPSTIRRSRSRSREGSESAARPP